MSASKIPDFRIGTRGWNYRLVRHFYPGKDIYLFAIHEVQYVDGKIFAIGKEPAKPEAEDINWLLEAFLEASKKPIIDYETRQEIDDPRIR